METVTTTAPLFPFPLSVAQKLLQTYDSPLYVYDEGVLKHRIRHLTLSIPYSNTGFHFASVTNGNIALLKIFESAGWGLHANTPGDIYLGLKAGFSPDKIVYSGSNLHPREMEQVLLWGVNILNLDSLSQVNLCCQVYQSLRHRVSPPKLGLRLNLPELTGDSRIGVRPEEFPEAIQMARQGGLKINGLHFYRGTGTNSTRAFTQVIPHLLALGKLLPDWEYLDFGGGFGFPYHHDGVTFDWKSFGEELTQALQSLHTNIRLIIEPGRNAIASCGVLLTQVVSLKWQEEKQIVGVDTTIANLSVISVHGGYREIVSWREGKTYLTDVCGNTTYSRDYLGKGCYLPALNQGDILAILDVGAYGYAMSSHFLHRPRPAEVLLDNGGNHRLVRRREDYDVLLLNQVFS